MDNETLVIILTNIDAGRWSKHDVRDFVDRILNHGATTQNAVRYVSRIIAVNNGLNMGQLKRFDMPAPLHYPDKYDGVPADTGTHE